MARGLKYVLCLSAAMCCGDRSCSHGALQPPMPDPLVDQVQSLPAIVVTRRGRAHHRRPRDRHRHDPAGRRGLCRTARRRPVHPRPRRRRRRRGEGRRYARQRLTTMRWCWRRASWRPCGQGRTASVAQMEAQLIEAKANAEEADKARSRARAGEPPALPRRPCSTRQRPAPRPQFPRVTSAEQAISVSQAGDQGHGRPDCRYRPEAGPHRRQGAGVRRRCRRVRPRSARSPWARAGRCSRSSVTARSS